MMVQRLIVTGPNGAGKSYLAALLAAARPDVPVVSFDAIKLASNWHRRPQAEIDAELLKVVSSEPDLWVCPHRAGGPSNCDIEPSSTATNVRRDEESPLRPSHNGAFHRVLSVGRTRWFHLKQSP
ncbi:hypothetical protein [Rhizobium leguminosarum]|uniref:hypothetical protein n=1 Tax=Rhizobium leguminosarum TaxID=384 RepID=UPI001030BB5D|nr:hypothetical protein [Rhizobium leguminosarum]TAY98650.1 hypothetical protein ELH79_09305 [Rhizobium leguminosarum]TAZ09415.1 hypothetical protein ELH78_09305 [Rhizobium leguminosarum]